MRLKFDARVYSRRAVEEAAASFAEHARFKIGEQKGLISVEIDGEEIDEEFVGEFSNHVLGGMSK
jgi:hypothetical protein